MARNFNVGDLVWARRKGYPLWPGEIREPPSNSKSSKSEKPQHYVLFYGVDNLSWVADDNIIEHNQNLFEEQESKQDYPAFQKAIETIMEKSRIIPRKESEGASPGKFKIPESSTLDKSLESPNSSSEEKRKKKDVYFPDMPQGINRNLRDLHLPSASSSVPERSGRPDTPPLNLLEKSAELLAKKIKPTHRKIGFLGLSHMGQGMVKNLQHSGHTLIIWNRSPEKCIPFVEKLNVTVASTPADVVVAADITFCCVSDAEASKTLAFEKSGVLEALQGCPGSNKGYIEMTSMDHTLSQKINDQIKLIGGRYLEAPIKGSRTDAKNGTLFIQAAGDKSLYDECKSCFDAIAKAHKYLSANVGDALKLHAVYGMFTGAAYSHLADVMALAQRMNVNTSVLFQVMERSPLFSKSMVQKCKKMIDNNYATQTPLKNTQKDVSLGLHLASSTGEPTPLAAAANATLEQCKNLGYGDHDVTAIFEGKKP